MTARLRSGRNGTLAITDPTRAFRLTVLPGKNDAYGLRLEETAGDSSDSIAVTVVTMTQAQTARVIDAIVNAVRGSGHQPSVLAFTHTHAIRLSEAEGVRLALVLLATQPVTRHDRIGALIAGVNAMSVEESYYWYGKCLGPDAGRARRALRVLLADD